MIPGPGPRRAGCFHPVTPRACRKIPWSAQDARKTPEIVQGIYLSARIQSEVTL